MPKIQSMHARKKQNENQKRQKFFLFSKSEFAIDKKKALFFLIDVRFMCGSITSNFSSKSSTNKQRRDRLMFEN